MVLPGLLDAGRFVDECCALLPRDLSSQERRKLDLPRDPSERMLRHRKWPALLGQSFANVGSYGGAVGVVRSATVEQARQVLRGMLDDYGSAEVDQLAGLVSFVFGHHVAAMDALCHRHNLLNNNEDRKLAGEIFEALLEVAEEYREPDLPLAMVTDYRGPSAPGGCLNKWLDLASSRGQ
jgi:hypothetical protein